MWNEDTETGRNPLQPSLPLQQHFCFPAAGFSPHTSFVLVSEKLGRWRHFPLSPSSRPGLAVRRRSPALQPDRGWLAEPAEAEVQGGARLLRRCPLCGRAGEVRLSEGLTYYVLIIPDNNLHVISVGRDVADKTVMLPSFVKKCQTFSFQLHECENFYITVNRISSVYKQVLSK